ncbi:LAMI_0E10660g1_1 [Lachancea mirantina]|uniref:LAMI_0E10660g1_1 n=1 Tax=Lachancea mirantina TaxID=1230905 RepID=A0A1G4JP59_9SACH|nr:LAMI_0E10660g1_1 [Lachancea mirantina]
MSAAQQFKPPAVTSVNDITCEQSQKLVQTMLTMSFGCLSFLRGLFPDDNFVDQRFVPEKVDKNYHKDSRAAQASSIKIKTLVRGKSAEADLFLDWLEKGVFQSVKHKYLSALSLGIFTDINSPTDLVEDYIFAFSYDRRGNVTMSVNGAEELSSLLDSRKVVQQLMRRFIIITQSLEPLPEKRYLTMRLMFNDEAPAEYQPNLFRDATHEIPATIELPSSADSDSGSVGSLDTGFHKVSIRVLTIHDVGVDSLKPTCSKKFDPFDLVDGSTTQTPHEASNSTIYDTQTLVETPKAASQTSRALQNYLNLEAAQLPQTQVLVQREEVIACECEIFCPVSTSKHVLCALCKRRMHKLCYGNSKTNSVTCVTCLTEGRAIDKFSNEFKVLMLMRRIYRFMIKRPDFPPTLSALYKILAGNDVDANAIDLINIALSILFSEGVFVVEQQRRKSSNSKQKFLKTSNPIFIDHDGIIAEGKSLPPKSECVWTFIPNAKGSHFSYTCALFTTPEQISQGIEFIKCAVIDLNPEDIDDSLQSDFMPSSMNFQSLKIDETPESQQTRKRKSTAFDSSECGRSLEGLKVANMPIESPNKIRKISVSKKTLRSFW